MKGKVESDSGKQELERLQNLSMMLDEKDSGEAQNVLQEEGFKNIEELSSKIADLLRAGIETSSSSSVGEEIESDENRHKLNQYILPRCHTERRIQMSYFEELRNSNLPLYQAILQNVGGPEKLQNLQDIDGVSASASYRCMQTPQRILSRGKCAVLFHTKHSPPLALKIDVWKKERPSRSTNFGTLRKNFDVYIVINDPTTNEPLARYCRNSWLWADGFDASSRRAFFEGDARYHCHPDSIVDKLSSLAQDPQYSELNPARAEWRTSINYEDVQADLGRLPGGEGFARVLSELPLEQDLRTLLNSGDLERLLQGKAPNGFDEFSEDVRGYSTGFRGSSRRRL